MSPLIAYVERSFSAATEAIIGRATAICAEYAAQAFDLTLRQLYYQFVARGLLPNLDAEYKRLGSIVNDARLAGRLDWESIVDRTRHLRALAHWNTPAEIVATTARAFNVDRWERQAERVEVWIEKDALVGVIAGVCERNDVPYFSCRGYTSQSEMWGAARRIGGHLAAGTTSVTVIHLGDHDPSGIDMTRDIGARLAQFLAGDGHDPDALVVERIALNPDQVRRFRPPPNPTKISDSRAASYIARYGHESWELDALDPRTLVALIEGVIVEHRDDRLWREASERQRVHRLQLAQAADQWAEVVAFLGARDRNEQGAT